MKKRITLIKLGGSVITNKEVPLTLRESVLKRVVKEVVEARQKTNDLYLIGHGQGSFAHVPAARYNVMDGFNADESKMGMAITQDIAAQLNRIVVREFLKREVPAVSYNFSNSLVTNNRQKDSWDTSVLEEYLKQGLLPITYGDVIVDSQQGCTIWSTDKIFCFLAKQFPKFAYQVEKVIHVTELAGVLDDSGKIISDINKRNYSTISKHLKTTKGFDVTGGMQHKLEELLKVADSGVESIILSGMKEDNLYNCLVGRHFIGTKVSK